MAPSIVKIAANISLLFQDRPLMQRFAAARDSGFDGVEIQFPYAESKDLLARAAEEAALPVVLINGPVSAPDHPLGIAARPEKRAEFRAQLPLIVDYAQALQVRCVHILAGTVRSGDIEADCMDAYVENLRLVAATLAPLRIATLIEPMNSGDRPGYLLDSLDGALEVIRRCEAEVGLQFDAYHVARMGLEPATEFRRVSHVVGHVQFADQPGRHEPGTGAVDFAAFRAALDATHYDGWAAAEYEPLAATATGLGWLRDWRQRST